MSNLRIISDNAIARASALTASTTAGTLVAANMLSDLKGSIWRATGTSATLTVTWATGEKIGCVALPYTNLSQAATIRVRAYSDAGVTLLIDTGAVLACPATPLKLQGWGAAASGVNAYAFGGGAAARVWISPVSGVKQLTIDLVDAGNPSGYVEASRLIAGAYWSPTYNAKYGQTLSAQDQSSHLRNDAGDLMTNIGTRSRKSSWSLSGMAAADRTALMAIIRSCGKANPVFFSLYPGDSDKELERDNEMYCKFSEIPDLSIELFNSYSAPVILEEV